MTRIRKRRNESRKEGQERETEDVTVSCAKSRRDAEINDVSSDDRLSPELEFEEATSTSARAPAVAESSLSAKHDNNNSSHRELPTQTTDALRVIDDIFFSDS